MKLNKIIPLWSFLIACLMSQTAHINSQCENWIGHPNQEEAENAHSIYRQELKLENYKLAFEQWKKAYEIAPAADGRRDYHFMDGVKLYKWKYENSTDEKKKKRFKNEVLKLYDQAAHCYKKQAITLSRCKHQECYDVKSGQVLGRKGFDMYYTFNSPSNEIYKTLKKSIDRTDKEAEYVVITPMAAAVVSSFENGKINKKEARSMHSRLEEIANYNIKKDNRYKKYYEQALTATDDKISEIEDRLYDCAYFKRKFLPEFRNEDPGSERIRNMYNKLMDQDCAEDDPDLAKLKSTYQKYAEVFRDSIRREREKKNPELAAKRLYDEEKFEQAIVKYREAINTMQDSSGADMDKVANWYFRMASIQGRKLNQYSNARSNAYKAAKIRPNWGQPYMLIADLYASTSRNCGDSWDQRLAILAAIDKYKKAKAVDPDVSADANQRIANYQSSLPTVESGHMRDVNEGDVREVGCWIGEKVEIRFK